MRFARGAEEAAAYLERNLDADELRLLLAQEDMAGGDYADAKRLYQKRMDEEQVGQ